MDHSERWKEKVKVAAYRKVALEPAETPPVPGISQYLCQFDGVWRLGDMEGDNRVRVEWLSAADGKENLKV